MNVRCPTCETVYRVDPAKVPAAGVRARCGVCAGVIQVSANGGAPAPAPAPAPAAPKAPTPTRRVTAPFFSPRKSATAPSPAAPPPAPKAPERPSAPVFKPTPGGSKPAPAAPKAAAPAAPPAPKPPAAPSPPAGGGAKGAFQNPFLAQDPRQKARRLARALVSDMIVYQPEKRQEALAAGNVKDAFEEEIKKSWEEYVEQIGEEIATSTPFWNEALNEILAGGQQIF